MMRFNWSSTAWVVVIALAAIALPSLFFVADSMAALRANQRQFQETQRATYELYQLPVPARLQPAPLVAPPPPRQRLPEAPTVLMLLIGAVMIRKQLLRAW